MKKLIVMLLTLMLIMAMAVPAHAATPSLGVPEVPQISDIKFDIKIELPGGFWDNWFEKNPIDWGSLFDRSGAEPLTKWKQ